MLLLAEGCHWWELQDWGSHLRWLWHVHKVAIHAPTFLNRQKQFSLHHKDRKMLLKLAELRILYLVVPRDLGCHHGAYRDWGSNLPTNKDGFLTYEDFVTLHTQRDHDLPEGSKKRCKCYLDADPTNGLASWLKYELQTRKEPPKIIVVSEDIHGTASAPRVESAQQHDNPLPMTEILGNPNNLMA